MQVDCINPLALSETDVAQWRALLAANPAWTSPYLTPDWAQYVARHRTDARVVVYRNEFGIAQAFLPAQRPNAVMAAPIGGPVCDYQALIGPEDLDLSFALKALNVGRIDFTAGLKDSPLSARLLTEDAGHLVRFAQGFDAWAAERAATGSKTIARTRKKLNKLIRDNDGDVAIEAFSTDRRAFRQLVAWKREQYARTGVTDIFDHGWIDLLVRDIFAAPAWTRSFGGAMFVLRVKGKPAAVLFCLRAGTTLHAWFVAHDAELADYSPGLIIFIEAIRAAAAAGYTELDLGPGDYPFKQSLANASRPIGSGFVGRPGFSAVFKGAQFKVRAIVEALPVGRARQWPAKAMRRLDVRAGLEQPHYPSPKRRAA
ncbi:MAG TPA: GNAT family N-acetyltransferase [Hyphomonadaceae bacterium]|nr:GNAT family N-acetyltransferase [Hyphomonadaceae bacterium]